MNGEPTRKLFAAVALSALAAVLASSAEARIPEGNGTQPPSRTVGNEQQAEIYAAMTVSTVVEQRVARQRMFFVDPAIYAAMTSSTVVEQRLARHRTGQVQLAKSPEGYRGRP